MGSLSENTAGIYRFERVRFDAPEEDHPAILAEYNRAKDAPEQVELPNDAQNDMCCNDH